MHKDILFETNRFNLLEVKPHFINPCCFGEDLAAWLRSKLAEHNIVAIEPGQEDWGWYTEATVQGVNYFIGFGGAAEESAPKDNHGEWRIMIERRRTAWDKLLGRNKATGSEPIFAVIEAILREQPDFLNVRYE